MPTADLPKDCGLAGVVEALDQGGSLSDNWTTLGLQAPLGAFVDAGARALLCSWAGGKGRDGRQIQLRIAPRTLRYLARKDLYPHLRLDYEQECSKNQSSRR